MDGNVAARTFATGLKSELAVRGLSQKMKSGVALQAELSSFTSNQQHAVCRAVRAVAGGTTFHLRGGMLMNIRSTFFHMALHAGIFLRLHETRGIQSAVRAVAIRALDEPLGDTMMNGLGELRSNGGVTRITEIRLRGFQQAAVQPARLVRALRHLKEMSLRGLSRALARVLHGVHKVAGMAVVTRHTGGHMTRMEEGVLLLAALVTEEAALRVLTWICPKCEDQLIGCERFGLISSSRLLRIDVSFSRPVTGLASHDGFRSGFQPRMRRLVEFRDFRFVTGTASVVADQIRRGIDSRQTPRHRRACRRPGKSLSQGDAPTGNDAENHNQHMPTLGTHFHRRARCKQTAKRQKDR